MVSFYLIIVILNMSSPSRKKKAITLETKYEIIQEVEKGGLPKKDVAAKFEILPNTLSTILKNITLNFLPPNTTSLLQPMDQGIINNLKIKYRQRLIKYILQCDEKKIEPNINVLMSIRFLKSAWSDVSVSCISNCFRKAGFEDNSVEVDLDPDDEFDEDDDVLLALYAQRFNGSFEDIVRVDENVISVETRFEDDIVNDILGINSEPNSTDSDNDDEVVESTDLLNLDDGINSIHSLRQCLERSVNAPERLFTYLCEIEKFIHASKSKQSKLDDYFNVA